MAGPPVLHIFALCSLLSSLLYLTILFLYPLSHKYFSNSVLNRIKNSKLITIASIYCILFSRNMLALQKKTFKSLAFLSSVLLISFTVLRFSLFCGYHRHSKILLFLIILVHIFSLWNSILRSAITTGNFLDNYGFTETIFLLEVAQKVIKQSFSTFKTYMVLRSPLNNENAHTLKIYGAIAGVLALPMAAAAAYDNHLSRVAAQEAAKAAAQSAVLQERALDIQERNSGNIAKHIFEAKWDEFGNKRKL